MAHLAFKYRRSRLSLVSRRRWNLPRVRLLLHLTLSGAFQLPRLSIGRMWRARVFSLYEEKLHELLRLTFCVSRCLSIEALNARCRFSSPRRVDYAGKFFTEKRERGAVKVRGRIHRGKKNRGIGRDAIVVGKGQTYATCNAYKKPTQYSLR